MSNLEKEYKIQDKDKLVILSKGRYWKTRRGLAYEFKCNLGSIWNDGSGGPTYFESNTGKYKEYSEWYLEDLIDKYEGV